MNKEILRKERIIKNYCKKRNWNPSELTTDQFLMIIKKTNYQN